MDEKKIKRKVNYYVEKYGTTDPYKLAKSLKVEYFFYTLGEIWGMYMYLKRHKCIFINSEIQDESMKKYIMAHELGHSIFHTKSNIYFAENLTNLKTIYAEREANVFAAQLILPDEFIYENSDMSLEEICIAKNLSMDTLRRRFMDCGLY